MQLKSKLVHLSDSTFDQEVLIRCNQARELEAGGKYDEATASLGHLWPGISERPETTVMDRRAAGELLLCVGVLTGWIGSTKQIPNAQERAKESSESCDLDCSVRESDRRGPTNSPLLWRQGAWKARAVA